MSGGQSSGNLDSDLEDWAEVKFLLSHVLSERIAFDEFRADKVHIIFATNFVNGENVGMIQRGGRPGFLLKTSQSFLIGCQLW
jgi:hypothetical protein